MMKTIIHSALTAHISHLLRPSVMMVLVGFLLVGCRSKIDLENIDTTSEIEMGVALPIGSVRATIGDFLGSGAGDFYVDTLQNEGVITWKKTFEIERNFHADSLDLTRMVSNKKLVLDVYDHLPNAPMVIGNNKRITGDGNPITLRFEMPLKLNGINKVLGGERLDSALIESANFGSVINTKDLNLNWEWINQVTLELGEQVNRPAGNVMTVYSQGDPGNYGSEIRTTIDHFTICLMKNRHLDPKTQSGLYDNNVIDSCTFFINFTFTVPYGVQVDIPENAGFEYELKVQFIKYEAIWGKFQRSNDMYDESVININEYLGDDFSFLSDACAPFADPKIDMHVYTHVAGALRMDGEYLYALDADGKKTYAEFTRGSIVYRNFPKQFEAGEYLDPINSHIGDSTTNMIIPFDKDPARGHLDNLFGRMPRELGYKFDVDFNYTMTPQVRITPNTGIRIEADCTLPFIFHKGVFVHYGDTIKNVDLSQYTIDSLLSTVEVIDTLKTTDIKVILHAKNSIPLDVKAYFRCLDENGNVIMDPVHPNQPLALFDNGSGNDTIMLKAPNYDKISGTWTQTKPGETTIIAGVSKAKLDLMPRIKMITYNVVIDDTSLDAAYKKGMSDVRLTSDQGLTVKIGITGKVDAVLNFTNND